MIFILVVLCIIEYYNVKNIVFKLFLIKHDKFFELKIFEDTILGQTII